MTMEPRSKMGLVAAIAIGIIVVSIIIVKITEPEPRNVTKIQQENTSSTSSSPENDYEIRIFHIVPGYSENANIENVLIKTYSLTQKDKTFLLRSSGNDIVQNSYEDDGTIWIFFYSKVPYLSLSHIDIPGDILSINKTQVFDLSGWLVHAKPLPITGTWQYIPKMSVFTHWNVTGNRTDTIKEPVWQDVDSKYNMFYVDKNNTIWVCCNSTSQPSMDGKTIDVQNDTGMILIHYYWPSKSLGLWRDAAYQEMAKYIELGYKYVGESEFIKTQYGQQYEIKLVKQVKQ